MPSPSAPQHPADIAAAKTAAAKTAASAETIVVDKALYTKQIWFLRAIQAFTLLFIITSGLLIFQSYSFQVNAIETTGKVVDFAHSTSSRSSSAKALVFTYTDKKGKSHTVESTASTDLSVGQIGDTISVLYFPNAPEEAIINSFFHNWAAPLLSSIISLIPFSCVTFMARRVKKNYLKNQALIDEAEQAGQHPQDHLKA